MNSSINKLSVSRKEEFFISSAQPGDRRQSRVGRKQPDFSLF